jgi:hypothetical protein
MPDALEVVIPGPLVWNHIETVKAIRQQHLNLFVVARRIALRIGGSIFEALAPFKTTRSQLVRS